MTNIDKNNPFGVNLPKAIHFDAVTGIFTKRLAMGK